MDIRQNGDGFPSNIDYQEGTDSTLKKFWNVKRKIKKNFFYKKNSLSLQREIFLKII